MLESRFNKVADLKETPTQLFFCKYCEIFRNNYFEEHLRTAAFKGFTKILLTRCLDGKLC